MSNVVVSCDARSAPQLRLASSHWGLDRPDPLQKRTCRTLNWNPGDLRTCLQSLPGNGKILIRNQGCRSQTSSRALVLCTKMRQVLQNRLLQDRKLLGARLLVSARRLRVIDQDRYSRSKNGSQMSYRPLETGNPELDNSSVCGSREICWLSVSPSGH